jgi:single-strand DNA-binding protein
MNQAEIIGTLSDEPKMSEGPNGPIAALSVVTKHKRPTEDGFTEEATQYHRVAVFTPQLARAAEGLQAGTVVHLKGQLRLKPYKDENGNTQNGSEIHVAGQYGRFKAGSGDFGEVESLNRCRIIGNLGADPVIKQGNDGPMAFFPVATTERWKDKSGGDQEATTWHQVAVFEPELAEYAGAHLKKGSLVNVVGEIRHGKYVDEGGVKRSTTQIQLGGEEARLMLQPLSQAKAQGERRDDNALDQPKSRQSRRR